MFQASRSRPISGFGIAELSSSGRIRRRWMAYSQERNTDARIVGIMFTWSTPPRANESVRRDDVEQIREALLRRGGKNLWQIFGDRNYVVVMCTHPDGTIEASNVSESQELLKRLEAVRTLKSWMVR